jgi:hypothetical protein
MKFFLWLFSFFMFLLTALFFFPSLVSTSFGKKIFIQIVEKKTNATIEIGLLHLSWLGPQQFEQVRFQSKEVDGSWRKLSLKTPLWKLWQLQGALQLFDGSFSFHSPRFGEANLQNVQAELADHQFSSSGTTLQKNKLGSFALTGNIEQFPATYSLQGKLSAFPSIILDNLLEAKGFIHKLAGDFFDLEGSVRSVSHEGFLDLTFSSPHCQTKIFGEFDGQVIRLQKPLTAFIKPSPAFSDVLTKDINPLFLRGIYAKEFMVLKLLPDNFIFPYAPFDLKRLGLQGSLAPGKLLIENGPTLRSLIHLLKNTRLESSRQMNAWFAPFDFRIQNSVVETGRLDVLLADSIHVCTWGNIDLKHDRLDMFLGLPAETLAQSFGIKELPSNYILKIPIKGTSSKPELITGPAIAQITALVAAQNLPIPKIGKIVGKVVNSVSQLKNERDVPPANRPFPWEK